MFSFRKYFNIKLSYKELGKSVIKEIIDDDSSIYSAAMSYYLIFSLFPFILVILTLLGLLPISGLLEFILGYIQKFVPREIFKLISDNLQKLFESSTGGLFSLGLVLAIWTSSSAISSLMDIMNKIWDVKENRPYWKARLISIILTLVLSILLLIAFVLLMFGVKIGDTLAGLLAIGAAFKMFWNILLVPIVLLLLIISLAIVYYFTPSIKLDWKWITPGAVFVIPCWTITSLAFSYYINNFGSYDKTYGTIGAVISLLLYLYIGAFILLIGAEINAVIEHSVKGDVKSPEIPLGNHGKDRKNSP